jgi:hypothetical protein
MVLGRPALRYGAAMVRDIEIRRSAKLFVDRHGADAETAWRVASAALGQGLIP